MRAASPPVSFFLHHAMATRVVAIYLLFTVALVMVPKADISETPFDESNNPTNKTVFEKAAPFMGIRLQSVTAFVTKIFTQPRRTSDRRMFPICAGRLTDSRTFRELFVFSSANPHSLYTIALWIELPFRADRRSAVARIIYWHR